MRHDTTPLRLKRPSGWFAAGAEFREALEVLSDGAFKLFAHLCLAAERPAGRVEATQRELARAIRKSQRIVGRYVAELERKGVCRVHSGRNQHSRTVLEIEDAYWPYQREDDSSQAGKGGDYVSVVREAFLAVGCATGKFGPADERMARKLGARGIPLSVVEDAILLGTCRKWVSLLDGGKGPLIGSLRYFEAMIAEVQEQPLTADYREYLRRKNGQLQRAYQESGESPREAPGGG